MTSIQNFLDIKIRENEVPFSQRGCDSFAQCKGQSIPNYISVCSGDEKQVQYRNMVIVFNFYSTNVHKMHK